MLPIPVQSGKIVICQSAISEVKYILSLPRIHGLLKRLIAGPAPYINARY